MSNRQSNKKTKPKRSPREIVDKLKSLGVTFDAVSEEKALELLSTRMNYFRVAAFRKNYKKDYDRKYIGLDFGALLELFELDKRLRRVLLGMCLDIEQIMKQKILVDIDRDNSTDGYDIVREFLLKNRATLRQIEANASATFTEDMLEKYFTLDKSDGDERPVLAFDDCPAWVLVEILNFGDFSKFYKFYYDSRNRDYLPMNILNLVRELRNGCAHNNELMVNLTTGRTYIQRELYDWLLNFFHRDELDRDIIAGRPTMEILALLYAFSEVASPAEIEEAREALGEVLFDSNIHKDYYKSSDVIRRSYAMIARILRG